jgi:hypothetical protein
MAGYSAGNCNPRSPTYDRKSGAILKSTVTACTDTSLQLSQEKKIEPVLGTSHEVSLEINAKMIKRVFMSYHYRGSLIKKKAANGNNNYCFGVNNP